MIRLAGLAFPRAARLARDPRAVVLLPLSAIEQHGPHPPLLVDLLGAEEADPDHLRAIASACSWAASRRVGGVSPGC